MRRLSSNPDLLVMPIDGRARWEHFFLGSVAKTVVRKATCPALKIRNQMAEKRA